MTSQTLKNRTAGEIVEELGQRVRQYRLSRGLKQESVARQAQVSARAVRSLEAGTGSTLDTLVRVLKALGLSQNLEDLVPIATISPMQMLIRKAPRVRGSR